MSDLQSELIGVPSTPATPQFTPENDRTLYEMYHSNALAVVRGSYINDSNRHESSFLIDRVDAVMEHVGPLRKRLATSFIGQIALMYPDGTAFAHSVIDFVTRDVTKLDNIK